jgi:hypothetical protein
MASAGAVGGGALAGAGTGAAVGSVVPGIGTAIGAVGGAIIGGLSGLLSSNSDEAKTKEQMMMRAADQRAAPWLAKAGVKTELTPYDMGTNHGTDVLQGALQGFGQYQAGQQASQKGTMNDALLAKLQGQNPGLAAGQSSALGSMGAIGQLGGTGAGTGAGAALSADQIDSLIEQVKSNPSLLSQIGSGVQAS